MSWEEATHAWAEQNGSDDGFYVQVTPPPLHTFQEAEPLQHSPVWVCEPDYQSLSL